MSRKSEEDPKPEESNVSKPDESILLKDLAPRHDVKGGTGKLRFGQSPAVDADHPT